MKIISWIQIQVWITSSSQWDLPVQSCVPASQPELWWTSEDLQVQMESQIYKRCHPGLHLLYNFYVVNPENL